MACDSGERIVRGKGVTKGLALDSYLSIMDEHAEILQKHLAGIQHRIVHDYMGVDYDVLWELSTRRIPPFLRDLEAILPPTNH